MIRNFFWNMFQYDGEVFVGAAHGDGILILKLELNKQRDKLVFRRFNPNAVRRMFESNEINVVEVPAIGGKATKIRIDQKLNFLLSRIRAPGLFEKPPFMSLHRAKSSKQQEQFQSMDRETSGTKRATGTGH